MGMDSISASVPQLQTTQFVPPPPVVETKPTVVEPPAIKTDSFESAAPKVSMQKVEQAQKTIASKGLFDLGKPVEPVVKDAGKELLAAGKYNGAITEKEATAIRANLSGDELKEFNKDFAAGKYSKPLEQSKIDNLEKVLNDPNSTYNALRKEGATVKQLGFNLMASSEYAAYKNPNSATVQVASANGRVLNTKS